LIIVTAGDPFGIGPEVTGKALKSKAIKNKADFIVIGKSLSSRPAGRLCKLGGEISFENIYKAVNILKAVTGRPKALVTAPINKFSLKKAGYSYGGHTEMLADLLKVRSPAMMFNAESFRVVLTTRHIPLSKVPKALTKEKIISAGGLFYTALEKCFKIKNPRVGVAGLNPHAGEGGMMGREELDIIGPAIRELRKKFINITGPYPPDVIFRKLYAGDIDGVVAMYHDQALGPFKMLYFEKGVNVTLGLPFIRTSPDHGTAFDIAGKNAADPESMIEAVKLAIKLAY